MRGGLWISGTLLQLQGRLMMLFRTDTAADVASRQMTSIGPGSQVDHRSDGNRSRSPVPVPCVVIDIF